MKFVFENGYWCVIRFSGNENVLRLFAEMPNIETTEKHIKIMEKFCFEHGCTYLTFENCTYNGVLITKDNVADVLYAASDAYLCIVNND